MTVKELIEMYKQCEKEIRIDQELYVTALCLDNKELIKELDKDIEYNKYKIHRIEEDFKIISK